MLLFETQRVIARLQLYERPQARSSGTHAALQIQRVRIDFESSGEPSKVGRLIYPLLIFRKLNFAFEILLAQ